MAIREVLKLKLPENVVHFLRQVHIIEKTTINRIKIWYYNKIYRNQVDNPNQIPVIINNFNRFEYLKRLIYSLERIGITNIYILDNDSVYPPLLEWYETCPYKVIRLSKNLGYMALWKSELFEIFRKSYYVYTDADLELSDDCPDDLMKRMMELLKRYPYAQKVGCALRIDDIPDCYELKDSVIANESRFWENEIEPDLYKAMVDTTFAMYRPYCYGPSSWNFLTLRLGGKYSIRHLPWYVDSSNLSEEELFYKSLYKKGGPGISTGWYSQKNN